MHSLRREAASRTRTSSHTWVSTSLSRCLGFSRLKHDLRLANAGKGRRARRKAQGFLTLLFRIRRLTMADPFVAEVRSFPFNFAPKGWAWCNGKILTSATNGSAIVNLLI